jgi:hypothetical protein
MASNTIGEILTAKPSQAVPFKGQDYPFAGIANLAGFRRVSSVKPSCWLP